MGGREDDRSADSAADGLREAMPQPISDVDRWRHRPRRVLDSRDGCWCAAWPSMDGCCGLRARLRPRCISGSGGERHRPSLPA